MEKQKKDEQRGIIYKSGVALDANTIPDYIREVENNNKKVLKVDCPFCCCLIKGHTTTGAKKCRYNSLKILGQLNAAVNDHPTKKCSEHDGECY